MGISVQSPALVQPRTPSATAPYHWGMPSLVIQDLERYGPDRVNPRHSSTSALNLDQAKAYVQQFTRRSRENFSVLTPLVPRGSRAGFSAFYAFCRWADDLADEAGSTEKASQLLQWWRRELDRAFAGEADHPVMLALVPVIQEHRLRPEPFHALIDAFEQDQSTTRYPTLASVEDYCTRSADPVGRVVLRLLGYDRPDLDALSDATCTALQLVNFWQDVRRDLLERNRVYLPEDRLAQHRLTPDALAQAIRTNRTDAVFPGYCDLLRELVDDARGRFAKGQALLPHLRPRDASLIGLFGGGGIEVCRAIERMNYRTAESRPVVAKRTKLGLLLRAYLGRLRISSPRPSDSDSLSPEVRA